MLSRMFCRGNSERTKGSGDPFSRTRPELGRGISGTPSVQGRVPRTPEQGQAARRAVARSSWLALRRTRSGRAGVVWWKAASGRSSSERAMMHAFEEARLRTLSYHRVAARDLEAVKQFLNRRRGGAQDMEGLPQPRSKQRSARSACELTSWQLPFEDRFRKDEQSLS